MAESLCFKNLRGGHSLLLEEGGRAVSSVPGCFPHTPVSAVLISISVYSLDYKKAMTDWIPSLFFRFQS